MTLEEQIKELTKRVDRLDIMIEKVRNDHKDLLFSLSMGELASAMTAKIRKQIAEWYETK